MSESLKIKPIIEKYLTGKIIDIGCGDQKICDTAIGVDSRNTDAVDYVMERSYEIYLMEQISMLKDADVIFASHVLEHLISPDEFLGSAYRTLKHNGTLILYLPDAKYYDNRSNLEHFQSYEHEVFVRWFKEKYKIKFDIIDHGPHVGENLYSFYMVARKK